MELTAKQQEALLLQIYRRIPYGVEVSYQGMPFQLEKVEVTDHGTFCSITNEFGDTRPPISEVKLYLFRHSDLSQELQQERLSMFKTAPLTKIEEWHYKYHVDFNNLIGQSLAIPIQ